MDGITALAAIRMEYPDARGILLTMHAREGDILRGMRAGAMGYVLKDAPLDTLLEARRSTRSPQAGTGLRQWWERSWPCAWPVAS